MMISNWLATFIHVRTTIPLLRTIFHFSTSTIKHAHTTYADNFRHPILTDYELKNGCRLGFDTWADTSCAGKHAYI